MAENATAARKKAAIEAGAILFCAVLLFVILLPNEDRINDLYITPDAVEYGTGAANLARTGDYFINVGHRRYPPMYPFGFALFQYPFLKLTGADVANIRYGLVFAAVGAVVIFYLVTRWFGGRIAATVGAILLAASPPIAIYCGIPMAETLFIFMLLSLMALGIGFCLAKRLWIRDLCIVGLGIAVGLGVLIRLNAVLYVLPVGVLIVISAWRQSARMMLDAGFFLIGFAPFAIVMAACNQANYGSFTRSGYAYWASYIHDDPGKIWRAEYAFGSAYNREDTSNIAHTAKSFLSLSTLPKPRAFKAVWIVGFFILALAFYGAVLLFRRMRSLPGNSSGGSPPSGIQSVSSRFSRPIIWLMLLIGTNILLSVIMLFYFYQDNRFHFSWLPIIFMFAGFGFARLVAKGHERNFKPTLYIVLPVFAALVLCAYVYSALYQAGKYAKIPPRKIRTIRAYEKVVENNAVIISDLYGPYISYWLIAGTEREHIPYSWGRARQYVMPLKPKRTPRAEYEWALQLLPKERQSKRTNEEFQNEVFPKYEGRDSLDEAMALGAEPLYRYAAATSPEYIHDYLERGRPVYLDTICVFGYMEQIPEELIIRKKNDIEENLGVSLEEVGRPAGRPLYRLHREN
ncbi:MAG: glycosyltransferase family 39 protein [Planctomycetota bacterium]|jgi:4-amino-4-deoxy-L-arabinose transferase-like glycosyltransferase